MQQQAEHTAYRVKFGYSIQLPFGQLKRGGELLQNPSPELVRQNSWKLEPVKPASIAPETQAPLPAPVLDPGGGICADTLLDGAWTGCRCFILGGGPSLKNHNLSQLTGELTIGVNRAFELIDPTIIFSIDSRVYNWIVSGQLGLEAKRKFAESKALKVWLGRPLLEASSGIHIIPPLEDTRPGANKELGESLRTGIPRFGNGGLAALNLAICLGANPIYLLGFDLNCNGKFQEWFHDGYPVAQRDDVYKNFLSEFENLSPEIAKKGVEIINLNPESALRCFPFGDMPDDLAAKTTDRKVTVITPTGDRPGAISLLRRWMERQTLRPAQWIIVDDGRHPLPKIAEATIIHREPQAPDPPCTLGENLKAALPHVLHEKVLVMEDDDWYGPRYIEIMAGLLDQHELVGLKDTTYYHLGIPGIREMKSRNHTSLAQTAFRKTIIPALLRAIPGDHSIDIRLWGKNEGKFISTNGHRLHLGIKGLPGRPGAGRGHFKRGYDADADYRSLKAACPDWEIYQDISRSMVDLKNRKADSPLVTISILCHNKVDVTRTCMEGLLINDNYNFEVIVSDNGSTDQTWEYLESINDKRVIICRQENIGFIKGHNQHLELARGQYFIVLNNDTEVQDSWLESLLAGFFADDRVKITGPVAGKLTATGRGIVAAEGAYDYIEGCCFAIPTAFARKIGLFSEDLDFMYSEDADLSLRVQAMGYSIKKVASKVTHIGNVIGKDIQTIDVKGLSLKNNYLLSRKWQGYLETGTFAEDIFIHRGGAQGDVLLLTPLLTTLKRENVHRRIYLSTSCPQLLAGNPAITGIISRTERPDAKWLDLDLAYENRPEMHIVDAYAQALGLPVPSDRHPLIYLAEDQQPLKDAPEAPYIVFHSPNSWPGRQIPFGVLMQAAEMMKQRGYHCLEIGRSHNIPNTEGRFIGADWGITIKLIKDSVGFIGIDSAPMHVAHALSKPGAVAFGCINPAYRLTDMERMRPVMAGAGCQFCHHWQSAPRTFSDCLRGDPVCMTRITPEQIVNEIEKAIRGEHGE